MTLDHVAKVGGLIFPVKRVASDNSLILALPNGGTLRLAGRSSELIRKTDK